MNEDQPVRPRRRKILLGAAIAVVVAVAVTVAVAAFLPARGAWHRIQVNSWSTVGSDDSALAVVVLGGYTNDVGVRVQVTQQNADSVVLQGWTYDPPGSWPAVGVPLTVVVQLSASLGDRQVLRPDGSTVMESVS